jgi:hypothetical protein
MTDQFPNKEISGPTGALFDGTELESRDVETRI